MDKHCYIHYMYIYFIQCYLNKSTARQLRHSLMTGNAFFFPKVNWTCMFIFLYQGKLAHSRSNYLKVHCLDLIMSWKFSSLIFSISDDNGDNGSQREIFETTRLAWTSWKFFALKQKVVYKDIALFAVFLVINQNLSVGHWVIREINNSLPTPNLDELNISLLVIDNFKMFINWNFIQNYFPEAILKKNCLEGNAALGFSDPRGREVGEIFFFKLEACLIKNW